MKLEQLEDLLEIDIEKNKADDNKRLLRKIKQILKSENKQEAKQEEKAGDLPYEGVSIVGNKLVTLKFDLESKEAVVAGVEVDSRDAGVKNYMAAYHAANKLKELSKKQKEK